MDIKQEIDKINDYTDQKKVREIRIKSDYLNQNARNRAELRNKLGKVEKI